MIVEVKTRGKAESKAERRPAWNEGRKKTEGVLRVAVPGNKTSIRSSSRPGESTSSSSSFWSAGSHTRSWTYGTANKSILT